MSSDVEMMGYRELETRLRQLDLAPFGRGNRIGGTRLISAEIERFAWHKRYRIRPEASLGLIRPGRRHAGRVDYLLMKRSEMLAIEIDSANKRWSLAKLMHAASLGFFAMWVRWCSPVTIEIPHEIYLVDLTSAKRENRG